MCEHYTTLDEQLARCRAELELVEDWVAWAVERLPHYFRDFLWATGRGTVSDNGDEAADTVRSYLFDFADTLKELREDLTLPHEEEEDR